MALMGMFNFAPLTICLLVFAAETHQTQASSSSTRGGALLGRKNIAGKNSGDSLCAISITVHGYKCQEHEVTTGDGYILGLQRIPEGRSKVSGSSTVTKKEPVLIQHGVMVDAMSWFLNSPEQNMPMILADNGFDVWVANARGTRFSNKHTTLDPSSKDYWNWSWDDMVTYDLPALFNYVSNQTGGQKINYVGHSLGTCIALTSYSEGKLVNQLKAAALLSPIAYLSHMTTALGVLAAKTFIDQVVTRVGIAEFNPRGFYASELLKPLCGNPEVNCDDMLTATTGDNCCLDPKAVGLFLANEPQPTSVKNLVHLSQTVRSGVLTKFNYVRPDENMKYYGQVNPPVYNLSNIPKNLPIFMSYGAKDALSDVEDVRHLLDLLKSHDKDKLSVQFIEEYAHADYMFGYNANDKVYNAVTEFFKRKF